VAATTRRSLPTDTIITPHPGEAARLLGGSAAEVQADRPAAAVELARRFKAWVVLKGAGSLVSDPDGRLLLSPYGSANLAVAGSGDVLAGMLGGVLAAGVEPGIAIPAAVALHAIAGEQPGWHRAGQLDEKIVDCMRMIRDMVPPL